MALNIEIIWDTYKNLTISDVHEKTLQRVTDYVINRHYYPHILYSLRNIQADPEEEVAYRKYIYHILRNDCSIVVVDKETNEYYGVALLMWMTEDWRSWTALKFQVGEGEFAELITLQMRVLNSYKQAHPERKNDSLHIFEYFVDEVYRYDSEFMSKFYNAIFEVGRHMKMSCVTFLPIRLDQQQEAITAGMTELTQLVYSLYWNKNKERIFESFRNIGERVAVYFEMKVEPLLPYYEMTVREAPHFITEEQKAAAEKAQAEAAAAAEIEAKAMAIVQEVGEDDMYEDYNVPTPPSFD